MKKYLAFIGFLVSIVAVVAIFSCDDGGDPRNQTRGALGEPDEIIPYEYSTFKAEVWVYARRDVNLIYEFRRTLGACGGDGQWYLSTRDYANDPFGYGYYDYTLYDMPPTIVHQPIESVPANHPVTISAIVTLADLVANPPNNYHPQDTEITGVRLLYRTVGDSLITEVNMSTSAGSDSVFTAQIPAEIVIPAGLEYAIEASSNTDRTVAYHWSHVPDERGNFIRVTVTAANTTAKISDQVIVGGPQEIIGQLPEPGGATFSPMQ